MAVAFDSVGPSSAGAGVATAGTTLAWTHTTIAASTTLYVGVCMDDIATTNGVSNHAAPTCNGVAMTYLAAEDSGASGNNGSLQVFSIALSSSGAQSISIPAIAGNSDQEGGSIAFTGVTGIGTIVKAQSTSITASAVISATASGNICLGFTCAGNNVASTTSPSVSRFVINEMGSGGAFGGNAAGATSSSTGSSVTMSWGLTSSLDPWAVIAVEVQGAAGGVIAGAPPQPGGGTWRRRHRRRQTLPPIPFSTKVDVNVTGVAASVGVQGGAGTPAGGANVTGVAASVGVQGGAGTPAGGANVTGVAAAVTVAGGAGTLSGGAGITGVAAAVSVQGGVGTPSGGANVTGVAAVVGVAGGAGTPSGGAKITGVAAAVTVQGGAGTPSGGAKITGLAAAVGVAGGVGTPSGGANVMGVAAAVGVAGGVGVPFGGGGVRSPENLSASFTYVNLGGTAVTVANTYGGTLTLPNYGGGIVPVTIDAVCTPVTIDGSAATQANTYGGTVNSVTIDASVVGWTMQQAALTLAENNDETVAVAITQNGSPLNIAAATINMLLKTAAGVPDGSALVLSSAGGSPAITITNGAGGLCSVAIPKADLTAETNTFYRIDVVISGLQNTAVYGNITWITL